MATTVILFNSRTPQYAWLSNFSPHPVGTFPTAEHAYQACKTLDPVEQDKIRKAVSPQQAKFFGRHIDINKRPTWDRDRVRIMKRVLEVKFRDTDLMEKLKSTVGQELVHYASWGDTFWGVDASMQGENMQGQLLMEIRDGLCT